MGLRGRGPFEFHNASVTMCTELLLQGLSETFFVLVYVYLTEAYCNTGEFSSSSWRFS